MTTFPAVQCLASSLIEAIKECSATTENESIRYATDCIRFEVTAHSKLTVVSTDCCSLTHATVTAETSEVWGEDQGFNLKVSHAKVLQGMLRLHKCDSVTPSPNADGSRHSLRFSGTDWAIEFPCSEFRFPQWRHCVPDSFEHSCEMLAGDLAAILKPAPLHPDYYNRRPAALRCDGTAMRAYGREGFLGGAACKGKIAPICIDAELAKSILAATNKYSRLTIRTTDALHAMTIINGSTVVVLMPIKNDGCLIEHPEVAAA